MTTGGPTSARHRAPITQGGGGRAWPRLAWRWTRLVLLLAVLIALVIIGWHAIPSAPRPSVGPASTTLAPDAARPRYWLINQLGRP